MTATDSIDTAEPADLFSPASRRERVVDWQAPGAGRQGSR